MAPPDSPKNIVIIGGGIIGSTSAYFLSHHPSYNPATTKITILEASSIASGASGKAGGLLGLWAYPSCLVPLSYRLHKELADKHNGAERWGYRAVHCGQLEAKGRPIDKTSGGVKGARDVVGVADEKGNDSVSLQKRTQDAIGLLRAAGVPKDLDWVIANGVREYQAMGDPSDTAQVHPYHFTTSMADLAQEKGVEVVYGSVTAINRTGSKGHETVESVTYTPKDSPTTETATLPADTVILSAGPWTRSLWPKAPISALRAHSVTIRPSRPVSAYALFTSIELPKSSTASSNGSNKKRHTTETATPEIYARPNNEVYACGDGDTTVPLPALSSDVRVDQSRCDDIVAQVSAISDELRDGEVTARQACYLPNVAAGGGPIVGKVPGVEGLVMAAGHTCWGIQNGPGTGKCVAEIVWDGKVKSADLRSLEPGRWL
ncbi:FAD dependent oxidoreductase [Saccharata proteae CBS 121410]|uniref:FAD dependent oxidoreductase n=1 Tax=Saccharata proteae CBS 121410 TaxID=1314787 RepID=A0A9P4HRU7_9PEZI|nr:FAD dependent oxidoreductase [Saccharata proteae CBS 121410]